MKNVLSIFLIAFVTYASLQALRLHVGIAGSRRRLLIGAIAAIACLTIVGVMNQSQTTEAVDRASLIAPHTHHATGGSGNSISAAEPC